MEALRDKIGMVMQKAVLFKGTIRQNLQWGRQDATDEEMFEALEIAQAKEFVDTKDGKLSAPITQDDFPDPVPPIIPTVSPGFTLKFSPVSDSAPAPR